MLRVRRRVIIYGGSIVKLRKKRERVSQREREILLWLELRVYIPLVVILRCHVLSSHR